MVQVERTELVTKEMDRLAETIRDLYYDHAASFRCPDPAQVDGRMHRAATADVASAEIRYGGFEYTADIEPTEEPVVGLSLGGHGVMDSAGEQVRVGPGGVFLMRTDHRMVASEFGGDFASLQVSWRALGELAEQRNGLPAEELRFVGMDAVSDDAARRFAASSEVLQRALVRSGTSEIDPFAAARLARTAAAALLDTFPNTTMTMAELTGPGWVAPRAVRRAAEYIQQHASAPLTVRQVAEATGTGVRALQAGFKRHLGLSPGEFLERVRLEGARRDLVAAEPGTSSVITTAHRWGWLDSTRFVGAYLRRYGEHPADTLRR